AATHLLAFDETVHAARLLPPAGVEAALRARPLRRGGGTSFKAVLGEAVTLRPAIAVILTDLDGAFPAPPAMPVLWAVPQAPRAAPPFGRVLVMDR
ncbi:MAG: VWA-like domain-containing protein, partial [Rhodosalinus sp.]